MVRMGLAMATVLLSCHCLHFGFALHVQYGCGTSRSSSATRITQPPFTPRRGRHGVRGTWVDTCPRKTRRRLFSPKHGDGEGPRAAATASPDVTTALSAKKRAAAGGWNTWKKIVSQRVEQENVLKKLHVNTAAALASSGLKVRTGVKNDLPSVSRLCVETFRGPFEWYMLPLQLFQEFTFFGQINARLGLVTRNEIKHGMVVVEDLTSNRVVGFLEIGMLPPPTTSEKDALDPAEPQAPPSSHQEAEKTDSEAQSTGVWEEVAEASGIRTDELNAASDIMGDSDMRKVELPDAAYLANVVVAKNQRRRGIGRMMVASAMEIVRELWPDEKRIYVTVEKGNDVAVALYEGLGFELTALEDEMLARSRRRAARMYLSKSLTTFD